MAYSMYINKLPIILVHHEYMRYIRYINVNAAYNFINTLRAHSLLNFPTNNKIMYFKLL